MPRKIEEYRIVVASPSDVFEERKSVFQAIEELDRTLESSGISIRGLGWEEYASPGISTEAQAVINEQLMLDYDILIALFGTKLGTPTQHFRSGTVEEFERALAKSESPFGEFRAQAYFLNRIDNLSAVSISNLTELSTYKNDLRTRGVLYREFTTRDELTREVRVNLQRAIQLFRSGGNGHSAPKMSIVRSSAIGTVDMSEEPGLLDLMESASELIEAATNALNDMGTLIGEIGEETRRKTVEIESISHPQTPASVQKKLVNEFAEFLESKSIQLRERTLSARQNFYGHLDAVLKAIELSDREFQPLSKETAKTLLETSSVVIANSTQARIGAQDYRNTIASLPRITIQFNKARRHLLETLDISIEMFQGLESKLMVLQNTATKTLSS